MINISPPTIQTAPHSGTSSASGGRQSSFTLRQSSSIANKDNVPSHIKMCDALNKAMIQRAIFEPTESVVIEENESVCLDQINPYRSLLSIFASAFLGEISRRDNLGLSYKNCLYEPTNKDGPRTIQQLLPNPLFMTPLPDIDARIVSDACKFCLEDYNSGGRTAPECVLFGDTDPRFELLDRSARSVGKSFMEAAIPSMKQNLLKAAGKWNELSTREEEDMDLVFQTRLSELTVDPKWNVDDNFKTNAMIYLSCETKENYEESSDDCDLKAMEYTHIYALALPPSVTRIDVLLSKECQDRKPGQAGPLVRWFQTAYPRAKVVGPTALDDTARVYSLMLQAKYLVCPPGPACLLPSLASTNFATIISHAAAAAAADGSKSSWVTPSMLSNPNTNILKDPHFHPSQCLKLRGRFGQWEQDMELAPALQYITPIYHYAGEAQMKFNATKEQPFRSPTTYKWVETVFPQCDMELLTLEDLCDTLAMYDITRLFFAGDSLAFNMAQSLWKLLLNTNNPTPLGPGTYHETDNWTRMFTCPNKHTFRIAFARNDQMIENNLPVSVPDKIRNCQAYCYKWTSRYREYEGKTVSVFATGPHYHHFPDFKTTFDRFLETIDSMKRPNDIAFFRTAVPGHEDCHLTGSTGPFQDYAQYAPTASQLYSWDKFIQYNDYVVRVLHERNIMEKNNNKENMVLVPLDVFPMTVLRKDGHVGGEEQRAEHLKGKDCLHYNMPGPVDWWNHFMYTQLVTLQKMIVEKYGAGEGQSSGGTRVG